MRLGTLMSSILLDYYCWKYIFLAVGFRRNGVLVLLQVLWLLGLQEKKPNIFRELSCDLVIHMRRSKMV